MSETESKQNGAVDASPAPVVAQNQNAPAEAQNQNAAAQRQPSRLESCLAVLKSLIIRALIIYFVSSFFRGQKAPTDVKDSKGQPVASIAARNIFEDGDILSLHVYLSEKDVLTNYSQANLFWYLDDISYGDWEGGPNRDGSFIFEKEYKITDNMKNNGSLYLHAFITPSAYSPDPESENYAKNRITSTVKRLNRFKQIKSSGRKNLLTGETEKNEIHDGKTISHWHPNLTLNLVTDQKQWTYGAVPVPVDTHIKFTPDGRFYKPVVFANDYWNMAKDYKPINESESDSLTLFLTFQPLSLFKWELYVAQEMRGNIFKGWGDEPQQTDEEQDTIKQTLLDTNPYLLGITVAVTLLHSVFEFLAFKNDIQFWNNRNSLEGLSVRSVFFGVFQSLIVLLYVMDNETNTLIRISCFAGLGIELWKIKKVVDIKFENGRLVFNDKSSYIESSTREYDKLAFKYLSWVCFPLLAGYSVYALLYLEHKGWYSFVLDILYGYLLTFGFIMMTPQLFINYKLKSVAHLPWRMLTYKFLNTFIDDMFAFVIKMPTMYRIGCFRDDIIFLIFLYQRWIYPVDKTRRNEYGYSEQDENQKSITEGENKENQAVVAEETKKSQ